MSGVRASEWLAGMPPASPAEPATQRAAGEIGSYALVRLLGRGGMGSVYEAVHRELRRKVAVKTLHEQHVASEAARQRLLCEGQACARIQHPNVIEVYDVGVHGGRPYLVMEYLQGEDLRRLLQRESRLSVQRCADLLLPVVAGLTAAHRLGVVHRDLKPENVFLSMNRGAVVPKVVDFGIAKCAQRTEPLLTEAGTLLGTLAYISPEQALGARELDSRSDQYSIGVLLYECCTGRRPLEEPSAFKLLQRIVCGDFAPARQHNPLLPSAFEALIARAMARDPQQRFPSTSALGRALAEFASAGVRAAYAAELAEDSRLPEAPDAIEEPAAAVPLGTTLAVAIRPQGVPPSASRRWPWLSLVAAWLGAVLASLNDLGPQRLVQSLVDRLRLLRQKQLQRGRHRGLQQVAPSDHAALVSHRAVHVHDGRAFLVEGYVAAEPHHLQRPPPGELSELFAPKIIPAQARLRERADAAEVGALPAPAAGQLVQASQRIVARPKCDDERSHPVSRRELVHAYARCSAAGKRGLAFRVLVCGAGGR
jgi:tRNA A-37 threonylcarbamoyl transferase component Bud32